MSDSRYRRARDRLLASLRAHGIEDERALAAFRVVPRHLFVPPAVRGRAYRDCALPIGFGQTISQPSIQALYLQTLELRRTDRVLEVGTGSGYQTALLAELVEHVYSIDRIPELAARARAVLDELRYRNVALMTGDGSIGWSRYAPFDAILVAAGAPAVPAALVDQLTVGGRMLVPVGDALHQRLTLLTRREDGVESRELGGCVFVPLVGRFGWAE